MPDEQPWHAAFPAPKSSPAKITAADVVKHLDSDTTTAESSKLLVVDVRRTDFEDNAIRRAINLPAHSFYPTLDGLVPLLSRYEQVAFHCQSSNGRGPRCAAWLQDKYDELGITKSKAVVLEGGIKGFVKQYEGTKYIVELPFKSASA